MNLMIKGIQKDFSEGSLINFSTKSFKDLQAKPLFFKEILNSKTNNKKTTQDAIEKIDDNKLNKVNDKKNEKNPEIDQTKEKKLNNESTIQNQKMKKKVKNFLELIAYLLANQNQQNIEVPKELKKGFGDHFIQQIKNHLKESNHLFKNNINIKQLNQFIKKFFEIPDLTLKNITSSKEVKNFINHIKNIINSNENNNTNTLSIKEEKKTDTQKIQKKGKKLQKHSKDHLHSNTNVNNSSLEQNKNNLKNENTLNKLNLSEKEPPSDKNQIIKSSSNKEDAFHPSSSNHFKRIFSSQYTQNISQSPSVDKQALIQKIAHQIKTGLFNGKQILTVSIKPDYLGKISIFLSRENGSLQGKMVVENKAVKEILESKISDLIDHLKENKIEFTNLDVDINHHSENKQSFDFNQQKDKPSSFDLEKKVSSNFEEEIDIRKMFHQVNIFA